MSAAQKSRVYVILRYDHESVVDTPFVSVTKVYRDLDAVSAEVARLQTLNGHTGAQYRFKVGRLVEDPTAEDPPQ